MGVIVGSLLRLAGVVLFLAAVGRAIRPRPLEVALLAALSVLMLLLAESLAPRAPAE